MKRIIIIIIAALAVVLAVVVAFNLFNRPLRVEAVICWAAAEEITFVEQGAYDYTDKFEVLSMVSGEVLEVMVQQGDHVDEGDVIATVDASEYQNQVEQLQINIAGYEGQIENLGSQEEQRRAQIWKEIDSLTGQIRQLDAEADQTDSNNYSLQAQIAQQKSIIEHCQRMEQSALSELNRVRQTADASLISSAKQTYDTAVSTTESNKLALQQLEQGITGQHVYETQRSSLVSQVNTLSAQLGVDYSDGLRKYYEAQIEATRANIEQMNEKAGQASITARKPGVIRDLPVNDKSTIAQQAVVAIIADKPLVEAFVPIWEVDGVKVGDTAELLLDKRQGLETMTAKVASIADSAEIKVSPLGVEERKVKVMLEPDSSDLKIGYDMDVRFTVYSKEDAIVVPKTAVYTADGQDYVWVIEGNKLNTIAIQKGMETSNGYIVDEGLTAGDTVVRYAENDELSKGKKAAMISTD